MSGQVGNPELASKLTEDPKIIAIRGREVTGLDIYKIMPDGTTTERAMELMALMNADAPAGGIDLKYGEEASQHLQYWHGKPKAPIIVYIHGGSWQIGTHLGKQTMPS